MKKFYFVEWFKCNKIKIIVFVMSVFLITISIILRDKFIFNYANEIQKSIEIFHELNNKNNILVASIYWGYANIFALYLTSFYGLYLGFKFIVFDIKNKKELFKQEC